MKKTYIYELLVGMIAILAGAVFMADVVLDDGWQRVLYVVVMVTGVETACHIINYFVLKYDERRKT